MELRLLLLTLVISYPLYTFGQCPPTNDLTFRDQTELDSFKINYPNCTDFAGDITIAICMKLVNNDQFGEYSIYNLSPLSNLRSLGGLTIYLSSHCWHNKPVIKELQSLWGLHNLTNLKTFSLSSGIPIRSIDELSNIKELESLHLGNTEIGFLSDSAMEIMVKSRLTLSFNRRLKDISGLMLGDSLIEVNIAGNSDLREIPEWPELKTVGEISVLDDNDDLEFLRSVQEVGHLSLINPLKDISVFENLKRIGDLELVNVENATDLLFLNHADFYGNSLKLTKCSFKNLDGLDIENNPNLSEINIFQLYDLEDISQIGKAIKLKRLGLSNLTKLNEIPDLSRLLQLDRIDLVGLPIERLGKISTDSLSRLSLNSLRMMENLEGLEALRICNTLEIQACSKLNNLNGLDSLSSLKELTISRNDLLVDVKPLSNLRTSHSHLFKKISIKSNNNLTSLEGLRNYRAPINLIQIINNPNLTHCSIPQLCWSYGTDARIEVSNNGSGCNNDLEVKEGCGYKFFKVFHDANENGNDESEEYGLILGQLKIDKYNFYPSDNGIGDYDLEAEFTDAKFVVPDGWRVTTLNSDVLLDTVLTDTIDFGLIPDSYFADFEVSLTHGHIICDSEYDISLDIMNTGTLPISGIADLKLPGTFLIINSDLSYETADSIGIEVNELLPGAKKNFIVKYKAPSISEIGLSELLNLDVNVSLSSISGLIKTKQENYKSTFLCSYDPNDKQVHPLGIGEENYTLMENEKFQYTIRFQNTGNYPATDVVIRDTLDSSLDINTFKVVSSSHPLSKVVRAGRVLELRFDNIFLADSVHNEPESHGYISYTIERYGIIAENTIIENTAHIYFDSNPAIVTNTTENKMVNEIPTSTTNIVRHPQLKVFPNPFAERVSVSTGNKFINETWRLYDSTGSLLQSSEVISSDFQIDLSLQPAGLYLLEIGNRFHSLVKL